MRHFRITIPAVMAALLFTCSSGDRIASSKGGSETTNGITARILHADGTPAIGSAVRLRKADYVSRVAPLGKQTGAAVSAVDSLDLTTDLQGGFFIAGIDPGTYCIEVNDSAVKNGPRGALLFTCAVDSFDTVNLGTGSLLPCASLAGHIDTAGSGGRQLFAQVRGLERLAPVEADGSFTFSDLPGGQLDVRIVDHAALPSAYELSNIRLRPGDTAAVALSLTSPYAACLTLDTAITGMRFTGTVTGFPMLLRLDSAVMDFSQAEEVGRDVLFTDAHNAPLPFEIELWNREARCAAVWVLIDTVSDNRADRHIIMHWGDSAASALSNGTPVFDTATGFAGVWHLNETPAGTGALKDRTVNGRNGTPSATMTSGNAAAGMIGAGVRFDGTGDCIDAGVLNLSGSYTISCWVNSADLATATRFIWKEFSYTLWYDAIGGGLRMEHFTDSLVWRGIYQDNSRLVPLVTDTWYYLAGTYDGDKIRLYINGEIADSTQSIGANPHASREPLLFGGRSGEYVKGVMDEVRIETMARSPEWIRLCYRNQLKTALP